MNFGQLVKIARQIYGYHSQGDLAKYVGLHLATIERYEKMEVATKKAFIFYTITLNWDLESIFTFIKSNMNRDSEIQQSYKELTNGEGR